MKSYHAVLLVGFMASALLGSRSALAQSNQSFEGVCTVASTTSVKGAEGMKSARLLKEEQLYAVAGDTKNFLIKKNGVIRKYQLQSQDGEFAKKRSMAVYESNKDEVWLLFLEDESKPPIFHMEFSDGQPHTWGACALTYKNEPQTDLNVVANTVYEKLKKEDYIKSNRVTVASALDACEMEFQHVYKDVRALSGKPVLLTGSFSVRKNGAKSTAFLLKVNSATMDFSTMGWKMVKPRFTNIVVSGRSFLPNYFNEFTCETGGRCVIYQDPKWELYASVLLKPSFDGEISISLEEGGQDYSFLMSDLMPKTTGLREQRKFYDCALEMAKAR